MDHTITVKPPVGRPSHQAILEMITEFETSGFSVFEYCEYKGLNESTFSNWLGKHRNKEEKSVSPFVPLSVPNEEASASLFAEFRGLRLYQCVEAAYLKELIS